MRLKRCHHLRAALFPLFRLEAEADLVGLYEYIAEASGRIDARRCRFARRFHDLALEFATHSYDVAPSGVPRIARW